MRDRGRELAGVSHDLPAARHRQVDRMPLAQVVRVRLGEAGQRPHDRGGVRVDVGQRGHRGTAAPGTAATTGVPHKRGRYPLWPATRRIAGFVSRGASLRTLSIVQRENRLGGPARRRAPRRDRRGRGLRTPLAPGDVPIVRSRAARFDDLVLDAIEDLEQHLPDELRDVEFAIEDVPPPARADFDPETVSDRGVALGQLYRGGLSSVRKPVIVIYRRPVEARTVDPLDRGDLVFTVVSELVAELLGKDIDEIDPE